MSDEDTIGDGDDRILAAEYVLGLLSPADMRGVEDRLGGDAALRSEVAQWQETFVTFTDPIPEVTPPEHLWPAITRDLDTPVTTRPRRFGLGVLGYALGGVLAAGLAWVAFDSGVMRPAAPEYQARIAAEDDSLVFEAAFDADTGQLALQYRTGGHAPGTSLEFWLIAEGQAPVSVIVWPDGSQAETVELPSDLTGQLTGAVLAISEEPAGGSPTGQPTGPVRAVGPLQGV
ncbi:anti-sigma factor [Pseudooceanicola onchidii]|uniref:anti-sigma factor n=1 Tax=Pseudooceanicola onchidii TaxID=2562279 RepID=UPI0010AB05D9|nr:anti-sigma factor [Pseudooceanicola onchidii]